MKILLSLLLVMSFVISSGQEVSKRKLTEYLENKIGLKKSDSEDKMRVVIMVNGDFDYTHLSAVKSSVGDRKMKRAVVVNELKSFTANAQHGVLSTLKEMQANGEVKNIKPMWITNAIGCEATIDAILRIAQREDVDFVDYELRDSFIPELSNDYIPTKSSKMESSIAPNITQMRAPEVWKMGYEGEGIVVGIIDTGVNYEHADLQGNLWDGGESFPHHGWNFDDDNNDPMDNFGHGTHCAGTVLGNGASGIKTGVAPKAKIMILKALGGDIANSSQMSPWMALEFAIENGADLVTGSFAVLPSQKPNNKAWRQVFDNFLEAGLIATIAAGNQYGDNNVPENITIPGKIPSPWTHPDQLENDGGLSSVLTVGAVDYENNHASFSSVGPVTWQSVEGYNDYPYRPGFGLIKPDLVAPGVDVNSLDSKNTEGYRLDKGTSMATPGVAGVVALMLSKNKDLTPAEIAEILQSTSQKLTDKKSNRFGAGLVDAYQAVLRVKGGIYPDQVTIDGGKITAGEVSKMSMVVKNINGHDANELTMKIETESPFIDFETTSVEIPLIANNSEISLSDVFEFKSSSKMYGVSEIQFVVTVSNADGEWKTSFVLPVSTSKLRFISVKVDDYMSEQPEKTILNNGILEKGEHANLLITVANNGSEMALISECSVTCDNDKVELGDIVSIREIGGNEKVVLSVPVVNVAAEAGENIVFNLQLKDESGVEFKTEFTVIANKLRALVVDKLGKGLSNSLVSGLKSNCYAVDVLDNVSGVENVNVYSSVWFVMGDVEGTAFINEEEEWLIEDFIKNEGKIYMEGMNTWAKDNSVVLDNFNIRRTMSQSGLTKISGVDELVTRGISLSYTSTNNQVYRLSPINGAFPILRNVSPEFNLCVANVSDYTTIGSTLCFENITEDKNSNSTKRALLSRLLMQMSLPSIYPEAVSNLAAVENSNGEVEVSWNSPFKVDLDVDMYPNVDSYLIYRDNKFVTSVPATECSFKDNEVGELYGVVAAYKVGNSDMITAQTEINSVNDLESESVKIFPNPAKDMLFIDGSFDKIELITMTGKIIYEGVKQQIDLTDVSNGVYVARIFVDSTKVVVKKITINK